MIKNIFTLGLVTISLIGFAQAEDVELGKMGANKTITIEVVTVKQNPHFSYDTRTGKKIVADEDRVVIKTYTYKISKNGSVLFHPEKPNTIQMNFLTEFVSATHNIAGVLHVNRNERLWLAKIWDVQLQGDNSAFKFNVLMSSNLDINIKIKDSCIQYKNGEVTCKYGRALTDNAPDSIARVDSRDIVVSTNKNNIVFELEKLLNP